MDNDLKMRLMDTMKKRGINIPNFSKQVGIPKERVYKWFQQGTQPKAEDSLLIENWINKGQMSLNYPDNKEVHNNKDAKIEALQYENLQLRLERIEANLKESLSNQSVMMRQVAVAMHLAAERYAGNDKKKLQEELNKIDKLLSAGFE